MLRGIKLDSNKEISITSEIVDASFPNKVYIPLINNGVICESLTKKGRKVKKGTIVGIREDLDFPVLSSVSGTVLDIKKCLYLNGEEVPCVVIENDKKERVIKKVIKEDITDYTKEEYVELLKECAVTGMGGGDFPTYLKYKSPISILIVNIVECEPYITADLMLTKLKADIILESIDAIMKINNIRKCFIAYKKTNRIVENALKEYISNYNNIVLSPVKEMYPMGWERHLVKYILNLDYDKYPSEVGVVVNNVSTIFAIYKALKFQRNITHRIVTISGDGFSEPVNVLAKIGTDMSEIIKKIGKYGREVKFIAGGPMMGKAIRNDSVIVTNNLGTVTIMHDIKEDVHECMGCGKCINVCPANLCPVFILKNLNNIDKLKELKVEKCIECGACSYICPSKLGLRDAVKMAKKKVKNK